tara:strand:- start:1012 stop:1221 length:210 start_codon:yes stop_codon:yes gene_type:complete
MDKDSLNIQVRKILKKVGIQSQREIENTIIEKFEKGLLEGIDILDVSIELEIKKIGLKIPIEGKIELRN